MVILMQFRVQLVKIWINFFSLMPCWIIKSPKSIIREQTVLLYWNSYSKKTQTSFLKRIKSLLGDLLQSTTSSFSKMVGSLNCSRCWPLRSTLRRFLQIKIGKTTKNLIFINKKCILDNFWYQEVIMDRFLENRFFDQISQKLPLDPPWCNFIKTRSKFHQIIYFVIYSNSKMIKF